MWPAIKINVEQKYIYTEIYDKFVGKLREEKFEKLKKNLSHQIKLFHNIRRENIDLVKCSYIIFFQ